MKKRTLLYLILALTIGFSSCRNDLQTADWDVNLLAPIISSELSLSNLVGDSNLTENPDSSLVLVYQTELASYGLPDLLEPFTYVHNEFLSLDSLDLPDIIVPSSISLGTIASGAGLIGTIIIGNNGQNMVIPALGNIPGASVPVDASEYFESISLVDGTLEMEIENGLPIIVEDFGFGLSNNSSGQILIQDTIPSIPPGATVTSTSSLAGKTIDSDLLAELYGLSSPGSNGQSVLIDTSNAIRITLRIKDLKPSSATTIWPAQNIINDTSEVFLEGSDGLELTFGRIRSGDIVMDIHSTINDSIQFEYLIPESDLNGQPFYFAEGLPAAPNSGVASIQKTYDFSGFELDLTGKNKDIFNTFYHIILGRIDSTGLIVNLSLEDSVTVELGMTDITIDYAQGDLGTDTLLLGPETTTFPGLSNLISGIVELKETKASLEVYNPIGASAFFELSEIKGKNSRTNQEIILDLSNSGNTIAVEPALELMNGGFTAETGSLDLNETNSNINTFLANLPDQISFNGKAYLNPNGPHIGFMYYDHPLQAFLNLEVPLNLVASDLTLIDTTEFSLGNSPEWDQVLGGELRLIADNGMPFSAQVELQLLAEDGSILETIIMDELVDAPALNAQGKVDAPKRTTLTIPLSTDRIERFQEASSARFRAVFNTAGQPHSVKIYAQYKIDLKLVGDLTYRLNN